MNMISAKTEKTKKTHKKLRKLTKNSKKTQNVKMSKTQNVKNSKYRTQLTCSMLQHFSPVELEKTLQTRIKKIFPSTRNNMVPISHSFNSLSIIFQIVPTPITFIS